MGTAPTINMPFHFWTNSNSKNFYFSPVISIERKRGIELENESPKNTIYDFNIKNEKNESGRCPGKYDHYDKIK